MADSFRLLIDWFRKVVFGNSYENILMDPRFATEDNIPVVFPEIVPVSEIFYLYNGYRKIITESADKLGESPNRVVVLDWYREESFNKPYYEMVRVYPEYLMMVEGDSIPVIAFVDKSLYFGGVLEHFGGIVQSTRLTLKYAYKVGEIIDHPSGEVETIFIREEWGKTVMRTYSFPEYVHMGPSGYPVVVLMPSEVG